MTPASQGNLTQNCHEKIKQNSHIIVILWELVRIPLPFFLVYFTHFIRFWFPIISSTFITKSVSGITPMGMRSTRLTPISVVDIKINTFYASLFLEEVFICFLCLCHYISGYLYRAASAFMLYFIIRKNGSFQTAVMDCSQPDDFNIKTKFLEL